MSSILRRIARNSSEIILGKLFGLVINLFAFILLANYLGPASFGVFTFAISFIAIFDAISHFGINQVILREISRDSSSRIVNHGITLKLIMSLSAVLLADLAIILLGYPSDMVFLTWILSLNYVISTKLSSWRTFLDVIFQKELRMSRPVWYGVIDAAIYLLIIIIGIRLGVSLLWIAVIYTLSNLPGFMLLFKSFIEKIPFQFELPFKRLKHILYESFPIFLFVGFSGLYTRADVFLLSLFQSDFDIGLYGAATRLIYPLNMLGVAISISFFPLMAASFNKNDHEFHSLMRLGFGATFLIASFVGVVITTKANEIVSIVYESTYAPATEPLAILGIGILFMFLTSFGIEVLLSISKQKLGTVAMFIVLAINLTINLFAIPSHSYIGASIAKVISFIIAMVLIYAFLSRHIQIFNFGFISRHIGFLALVVAVTILIERFSIIFFVPLTLIAFVALAFLFRLISLADINMLRGNAIDGYPQI